MPDMQSADPNRASEDSILLRSIIPTGEETTGDIGERMQRHLTVDRLRHDVRSADGMMSGGWRPLR